MAALGREISLKRTRLYFVLIRAYMLLVARQGQRQ